MNISRYFLQEQCTAFSRGSFNKSVSDGKGIYDKDEVNHRYPINPVTGLPDVEVSTLLSPTVTESEKAAILNRLTTVKGSYLPSGMSDEDILTLVPSRYLTNDPLDVQAWRDYIGKLVKDDEDMRKYEALMSSEDDNKDKDVVESNDNSDE